MKKYKLMIIGILLVISVLITGCSEKPREPKVILIKNQEISDPITKQICSEINNMNNITCPSNLQGLGCETFKTKKIAAEHNLTLDRLYEIARSCSPLKGFMIVG